MTDRDLTRAEVEALLDRATNGPWVVERNKRTWGWVDVAGPSLNVGGPTQATDLTLADEVKRLADARLIAAAPTLAAQLLRCMDERDLARTETADLLTVSREECTRLVERAEAAEAENARLRGALKEALAEAPEVQALIAEAVERATRVKPLEWVKHPSKDIWRAIVGFGVYKVFGITYPSWDFDSWSDAKDKISKSAETVEAAKAAAQADYEQRIRAAIGGNENE